jgi:hypothetical protein
MTHGLLHGCAVYKTRCLPGRLVLVVCIYKDVWIDRQKSRCAKNDKLRNQTLKLSYSYRQGYRERLSCKHIKHKAEGFAVRDRNAVGPQGADLAEADLNETCAGDFMAAAAPCDRNQETREQQRLKERLHT